MIFVHKLNVQGEDDLFAEAVCGAASGDFAVVAHEEHIDGNNLLEPDCIDPATIEDSIRITSMHESAHGDFRTIEPEVDWCTETEEGQRKTHDDLSGWAMAVGHCGQHDLADFHVNRWTEYADPVGPDNIGCDMDPQTEDDDECGTFSPGDLNNGL